MLLCMREIYVSMKRVPVATGRHVVRNQLIAKTAREGKTRFVCSISLTYRILLNQISIIHSTVSPLISWISGKILELENNEL